MKEVLFGVIDLIFSVYVWIILLRILLQYIHADYFNPISQLVIKATDYPCKQINRIMPKSANFDLAGIVLLFVVEIFKFLILAGLFSGSITFLGLIVSIIFDTFSAILNLYFYMIIIVAIASWVSAQNQHPALSVLKKLTDPILNLARRYIPNFAGIDFSPIVVLVLIKLIDLLILMPLLHMSGMRFF